MAPSELKALWVSTVRRIGGTDRYFIGDKWDTILAEVAAWLEANPHIKPLRFVEAQVNWCLRNRVKGALWPNLMSGPKALQRYLDEPDDGEIVAQLEKHYSAQANAFIQLTNSIGLKEALEDTMVTWSPLYLAYVRHHQGLAIPEDLRVRAAREASAESLINQVFPAEFLRSLA